MARKTLAIIGAEASGPKIECVRAKKNIRVRITIQHDRPKQEMKDSVEQSVGQLFSGFNLGVIEFTDQRKEWSGDTLKFSLTANLGFLRTPLVGWALVTDTAVTLDVDLGLLGKLIPEQIAKTQIAAQAKRLLR